MSDTSDSWPEQDAVEAWVEKFGISVDRKVLRELKDAVTQYRLEVQKELEALRKDPLQEAIQQQIFEEIEDPQEITTTKTLFEHLEYTFSDYSDIQEAFTDLKEKKKILEDQETYVLSLPESND